MKSDQVYLKHILEATNRINEYVGNLSREDFAKDYLKFDATTRQIMILGEAVTNISDDFIESHPTIPWHKIVGMRNRLIHEYFGVDPDIVWETVRVDVQELKKFVEPLVKS